MKKILLNKYSYIFIFVVLVFFSCSDNNGPLPIVHTDEALTLKWSENSDNSVQSPSSVEYYNVYYRPLGSLHWDFIKSIDSNKTSITILKEEVGSGKFEFAIESVFRNGNRGELHTSTDYSSWPTGGWYIYWN